jgi:hypothetical protein
MVNINNNVRGNISLNKSNKSDNSFKEIVTHLSKDLIPKQTKSTKSDSFKIDNGEAIEPSKVHITVKSSPLQRSLD